MLSGLRLYRAREACRQIRRGLENGSGNAVAARTRQTSHRGVENVLPSMQAEAGARSRHGATATE